MTLDTALSVAQEATGPAASDVLLATAIGIVVSYVQLASAAGGVASLWSHGAWRWTCGYLVLSGTCAAGTLYILGDLRFFAQVDHLLPIIAGLLFPSLIFSLVGASLLLPLSRITAANYSSVRNVFLAHIARCNVKHWMKLSQILMRLEAEQLRDFVRTAISIPNLLELGFDPAWQEVAVSQMDKPDLVRLVLSSGLAEELCDTLPFESEARWVFERMPLRELQELGEQFSPPEDTYLEMFVLGNSKLDLVQRRKLLVEFVLQHSDRSCLSSAHPQSGQHSQTRAN